MTDTNDSARDWRDTVFLPKTDFPMKAGLPAKEPVTLAHWQDIGLYEKLRAARAGREKFILHDGPPYANGDMHIGHALNHILKDMVCRTRNLMGYDAPYVPGWDCHGLPIEWKVEEEYRAKKRNKDEVPPAEFRAECRAYAQKWVDTQREQLKRLGILGDWDHPYLTMQFDSEATIVSELLKFAESGQLYRGAKPVMWSPVEKTALAEAEVEYEDITSTQIDVAFEITEAPNAPELQALIDAGEKIHAVIWTTTPWTIPVNQALAYGEDVDYWLVTINGHGRFLIAERLIEAFGSRLGYNVRLVDVHWRGKGTDLAGAKARHPMHHLGGFFKELRPLLPGEFVTTDAGTGLVHMAPDHGEDDFLLCKKYSTPEHPLDPVFAVEADGKYKADWPWVGGLGPVVPYSPKGADKFNAPDGPVCSALKDVNALLSARNDESTRHSYPHSWRSKAKVIFRCTPQWFVPMDRPLQDRPGDGSERAIGEHGEPPRFHGRTLRELAVKAIGETKFYPEKGRNRISAMVEGRPDWVLSRQRAWGVPITLFVDRKTGQYLNDPAVNARIIAAVREGGVDAWTDERAQDYLGSDYAAADYERVTDILDVWFDSGSTHAFVLESGRWPDLKWPADLYLEGSDQHRGWFQSSLLESCGTRGRAPYDAVLTHGFTMDAKGMKMSKSLGNTISPIDLMKEYGADILRLWALSVDFTEDHRIGKEILAGVADQYRKLRNTFRYLLGALDGFGEDERVAVKAMPALERHMLSLLGRLDVALNAAAREYDFNRYVRLLIDFANDDLSAFFFDIRKDSLYCDGEGDATRRAYRTVLDVLFHALVRYAAPVLVFTAEEVWQARFPDAGMSVHLLEWPELPPLPGDHADEAAWSEVRALREAVTEAIEPLRRDKIVRSSLEAEVTVPTLPMPAEALAELFIVAKVTKADGPITVSRTDNHKCGRCWRLLSEVAEDGALCHRCTEVVSQ